jgi:uncharacterized linocin/CFP29 family protein
MLQIADSLGRAGPNGSLSASPIAQKLLAANFNANALRTQATLRIREWIQYDTAVIDIARRQLVGIQDLVAAGLTYPIQDALGITRIEWEKISTMTPAEISMSGLTQTQNDRQEFGVDSVPLPIFHKDFKINVRQLHAGRRLGTPIDTTQAQLASRLVTERMETVLFAGATVLGSNTPLYGYTTALNRNTGSVTASWTTATGSQIVTDVLAMINAATADNMYGPYMLYVPSAVYVAMGADFKANGDRTIMERVLAIPGIKGIKQTKDLTASNVLLVQMSADVVDIVDGMQPTTLEWETAGGFEVNFKVMAIMVPRMKSDYVAQSGIVHYS